MTAWFYVLRLKSGALYVGATKDINKRYKEHMDGDASRTTQLDLPDALIYYEEFPTFTGARRREAQVKRWTRAKKEALITGDFAALKALARRHERK